MEAVFRRPRRPVSHFETILTWFYGILIAEKNVHCRHPAMRRMTGRREDRVLQSACPFLPFGPVSSTIPGRSLFSIQYTISK